MLGIVGEFEALCRATLPRRELLRVHPNRLRTKHIRSRLFIFSFSFDFLFPSLSGLNCFPFILISDARCLLIGLDWGAGLGCIQLG